MPKPISKEAKAAYDRLYRQRNAETLAAYARAYYLANCEEKKAKQRAYHATRDPADLLRVRQEHRAKHLDVLKARRKQDYADNRRRYIDKALDWKRENPLRWAHNMALERARRYGVEVSLTVDVWLALVERFGGACAYCGAVGKCGVDHNIPLCRGGAHSLENVLPCCGPCNSSKNKRTPLEWLVSGVPRSRLIAARGCLATG